MSTVHLGVPFIVRRRLLLNPVAIFVGIIFLGWIWGIPGALLAVPLLASFKTICERVGPSQPDCCLPYALSLRCAGLRKAPRLRDTRASGLPGSHQQWPLLKGRRRPDFGLRQYQCYINSKRYPIAPCIKSEAGTAL